METPEIKVIEINLKKIRKNTLLSKNYILTYFHKI